jgi:DHA2 family multidrug resistance protein
VPLGALAFAGIWFFLRETKLSAAAKLDWLGFGSLSVAIAAMQSVPRPRRRSSTGSPPRDPDRGGVCVSAFYVFLVHTFTATNPS